MKRSKYTRRKDGSLEYAPSYRGQRKHFYGHTDAEIEAKVRKWQNDIDAGISSSGRLMDELIEEYWGEKCDTLSPNSYNSYRSKVEEIRAEFGKVPVAEMNAAVIIQWLRRYKKQNYAQKGISDRRSIMKCILDEAVGVEFQTNPCLSLPSVISNKPEHKRRPASEDDVKK